MKVQPLYDRVIIEVADPKKSTGGIHIPSVARESSPLGFGFVLAVGPGLPLAMSVDVRPMRVKVGDAVWYSRPSAQSIPYPDKDAGTVVVTNEPNILAILTELPRDTGLVGLDGGKVIA